MTKLWSRSELTPLVNKLQTDLAGWCYRVSLVGSWRRGKPRVHDLDMLCLPLGGWRYLRQPKWWELERIREYLKHNATWLKGGDRMMSVDNLYRRHGLRLDLFICHDQADWHSLLAFRTGPAELCVFAKEQMKAFHGAEFRHAAPWSDGRRLEVGSEKAWFDLAEIEHVAPHRRESLARKLDVPLVRGEKVEE